MGETCVDNNRAFGKDGCLAGDIQRDVWESGPTRPCAIGVARAANGSTESRPTDVGFLQRVTHDSRASVETPGKRGETFLAPFRGHSEEYQRGRLAARRGSTSSLAAGQRPRALS